MQNQGSFELTCLLKNLLAEEISVQTFCDRFEDAYNLRVDRSSLSELERRVFSGLFEEVVWYSPFPEERTKIPNYLGETEILSTARRAAIRLGLWTGSTQRE